MLNYSINEFLINLSSVYNNPLVLILIFIFLCIFTYTDIKSFKIYNKFIIVFLLIRIALIFVPIYNLPLTYNHIAGAIVGSLILLIPAIHFMQKMGGDIKLVFVLGLYFGIDLILLLLGVSFLVIIIYSIIVKLVKKEDVRNIFVPLAPFFMSSFCILLTINFALF